MVCTVTVVLTILNALNNSDPQKAEDHFFFNQIELQKCYVPFGKIESFYS